MEPATPYHLSDEDERFIVGEMLKIGIPMTRATAVTRKCCNRGMTPEQVVTRLLELNEYADKATTLARPEFWVAAALEDGRAVRTKPSQVLKKYEAYDAYVAHVQEVRQMVTGTIKGLAGGKRA